MPLFSNHNHDYFFSLLDTADQVFEDAVSAIETLALLLQIPTVVMRHESLLDFLISNF